MVRFLCFLCVSLFSAAVMGGNLVELVRTNGTYPVIPLKKNVIVLKIVQSAVQNISSPNESGKIVESNLNNMIKLARKACVEGKKPDILLYHEFPLTGYFQGTRDQKLDVAIEIPGPETRALGEIAKECDAYLIFGSYAKDAEWPGHVLSINTVINRKGNVVKKFWKQKNIKRFYPTFEITTTTIESVRDKFRQKYGIEEEFPVLRTEFGNIAVSTVQLDPLVFQAFAMRGVELMLRTATLYFESDVIATAQYNNFYSAMGNMPYDSPYGGRSLIVSPDGTILAQHPEKNREGIVTAEIPIADFRKNRRIPQVSKELVESVFQQYQQEIPLNYLDLPQSKLPQDGIEMKKCFDQISRW